MSYTRYSVEDVRRRQRRRSRKQRRATGRAWKIVRVALVLLVLLLVAGVAAAAGAIVAVSRTLPDLDDLERRTNAVNTTIYDRDGRIIAVLHGAENRTLVSSKRIPDLMKQATVAVEDQRYYEHHGVDFQGVVRAMVANVRAGSVVEGGSTITAQYVKNAYVGGERTYTRKLREAVLAWQLEDKWGKDRILSAYLNTVYYGAGAYGVEAAARTYFHKNAKALTLKEAALLAALPRLPSQYSPVTDPKLARERRNMVLDVMADQGYITPERAKKAKNASLGVYRNPPNMNRGSAAYFVDYVTRQLIKRYGTQETFGGGLRVYTSLDLDWQNEALRIVKSTTGSINFGWEPAAALVAVEPKTGYIRTMVGGTDFKKQKFNLAWQARRQAGSAFKTFTLTAAVRQGMDPNKTTYVAHSPTIIPMGFGQKPWVVNGDGSGKMNVTKATWISENTVFAQLCVDAGPEKVADTAHDMGINSPLAAVPSLTLGTSAVNPLEMADAYATLASGGMHHPPQGIVKVVLPNGKVDWRPKTKGDRALPAGVASTVTQVLKGVAEMGTGSKTGYYFDHPRAGKTGTTDESWDVWYCGYTPQLSAAVWMGNPDKNSPMPGAYGGDYCAPMWAKFMAYALKDEPHPDFPTASWTFKPWKGKYSTSSPSASGSESATPTPTTTKTVRPTPGPTATKTVKPTPTPTKTVKPTPTPTVTNTDGGRVAPLRTSDTGSGGGGLLGWLSDLVGGAVGLL